MKECTECNVVSENFRKHRRVCLDCERRKSREYYHKNIEQQGYNERRAQKEKQNRRDNPALYLYRSSKIRAKKFNLDFDLEKEDIIIPDVCPVLRIPLFVGEKQGDNSPTLDRVDNSKGYTKDNVAVISWKANNLKSNATLDEIEKLYLWMKDMV